MTGCAACRYYDATVGELNYETGEVTVLFDSYQHSEVTKVELLRDLEQRETIKRKAAEGLMAGSKIKYVNCETEQKHSGALLSKRTET